MKTTYILDEYRYRILAPTEWTDEEAEQMLEKLDGLEEKIENAIQNAVKEVNEELEVKLV